MPLFDYRCNGCGGITEVFLRRVPAEQQAVPCGRCASGDTVRMVSRFAVKPQRVAKYSEDFREKALPYLKGRPGAREMLAEGGQSEEAAAFELTERIGARVDTVLEDING
ncbi:MAG: FmdB family zinc ribbon protein [Chloroflexota bacterium]